MVTAILLTIGIVEAVFGYRMYKIKIAIIGFFVFGLLGVGLGIRIFGVPAVSIILMMVFAIVGWIVAVKIWMVGVFIQCFGYGYLFCEIFLTSLQYSGSVYRMDIMTVVRLMGIANTIKKGNLNSISVSGIIVGLIFGVLGVIIARIVIIITSSLSGGVFFSLGLACYGAIEFSSVSIAAIITAIIGMIIQFEWTGKEDIFENNKKPAKKQSDAPCLLTYYPEQAGNYLNCNASVPYVTYDDNSQNIDNDNSPNTDISDGQSSGFSERGYFYCYNCGILLPSDAQYCSGCGAKQSP